MWPPIRLTTSHDIFLSYANAALDLARALHDELEALGVKVWMDDFSIKLGQNIVRAIDRHRSAATVTAARASRIRG